MSKKCKHYNIVIVLEHFHSKEWYQQVPRTHVECENCGKVLPIHRITIEHREITHDDNSTT